MNHLKKSDKNLLIILVIFAFLFAAISIILSLNLVSAGLQCTNSYEYKTFDGYALAALTSQIPDDASCMFWDNAVTADAVCKQLGYTSYSTFGTGSYSTPFDNCIVSYDPSCGNWTPTNAMFHNIGINSLTCYETIQTCVSTCVDVDKDGYDNCNLGEAGDDGKPVDCNDNNANVHPGASEVCNGIDDNCNGQVDETSNICGAGKVCTAGQCQQITCNSNSDCGTNSFINALFCQGTNVFQNYITYTCNNPGTINSICTNSTIPQLKQTCSTGQTCSNGNCVNVTIICSKNSDCGTNSFIDGLFCQGNSILQNYITYTCTNSGTINSACTNTTIPQLKQTCSTGQTCSNGNCIPIPAQCVDNDNDGYDNCSPGQPGDDGKAIDCNDNNANVHPNASETCNGIDDDCDGQIDENNGNCGPGKICSNGECKQTICNSNSDCGTNSFIDALFCQGTNVFQNYITYTCNNPGTSTSSCSNILTPQLKQTCPQNQACYIGQCVNIVCTKNSNCGIDEYVSENYCKSGDVYRDLKEFFCNNPGLGNSQCNNKIIHSLINECKYGCSNGECKPKPDVNCINEDCTFGPDVEQDTQDIIDMINKKPVIEKSLQIQTSGLSINLGQLKEDETSLQKSIINLFNINPVLSFLIILFLILIFLLIIIMIVRLISR